MKRRLYKSSLYVKVFNTRGERAMMSVAKLVLLAFGNAPYQDEFPWFRDGNRQNPQFTNLEWRPRKSLV